MMTHWTAGFAVIALASLLLMGCGGDAGSTGGSGGEPNAECNGDGDCSDGNECTAGSCSEGACAYTNLADGTPCTVGECSAGLCSATGPSGCAAEASATFADGNFADGDWTYAAVDGVSQGMRMIDSVRTVQSGGNPDAYQRVEVTLTATTEQAASIWVAHALQRATYDPSSAGEICGFRFSLDGTDQFDLPARSTFYTVFLLQNDTFYWNERWQSNQDRWQTHVWTRNDWVRIDGDGPPAPVLDGTGSEIQLGYMTGSSRPITTPDVPGTTITAADNFSVEIFPPAP